jgi:hypothetical protein
MSSNRLFRDRDCFSQTFGRLVCLKILYSPDFHFSSARTLKWIFFPTLIQIGIYGFLHLFAGGRTYERIVCVCVHIAYIMYDAGPKCEITFSL